MHLVVLHCKRLGSGVNISLEVGKKKPGEKVDIMEFMYESVSCTVKHMLQNFGTFSGLYYRSELFCQHICRENVSEPQVHKTDLETVAFSCKWGQNRICPLV